MKLTTREITVFAMLGAVMYASKIIMEVIPNVHLLGTFTIAFTVVYRKKALYPIYTYVILNGIFSGFATWWLPYLYLWTVLWSRYASSQRNAPKDTPVSLYDGVRPARLSVRRTLCAGPGGFIWDEP